MISEPPHLDSPYVNRELSWIEFNRRVLMEAARPDNPILERVKFLAIFGSNLDEFFMVRVSGLIEQEAGGVQELSPDGMTPTEQLRLVSSRVRELRKMASRLWEVDLRPGLSKVGVNILDPDPKVFDLLAETFRHKVFPLCTPQRLEARSNSPFISNRSLNLAVELVGDDGELVLARLKVPPNLPRFMKVPGSECDHVLLEDLIAHNLPDLFPGVEIVASHKFRVIRDADVEIREIEAADLITAVEATLHLRRFGDPVMLETAAPSGTHWKEVLRDRLELDDQDCFEVEGLLGFESLWELHGLNRPELKYTPYAPFRCTALQTSSDLFETVRSQDVLVHHPYDSFDPVETFVASAAEDPDVAGIKITLYRVGSESPIVRSLLAAAEKGKQVAAMVELKARFDESNNLVWSRALEEAGVHVTYGFREMKVHSKLCLVVRQEEDGVRSYAHIGTGNYNPETARAYTDLGLFTSDPEICQDVTEMFNFLTGFSKQDSYRRLLVAPHNLREEIIDRIECEVACHKATGDGEILFKLNSLVDPEVIDALYEASAAGVEIKLAVRGICCLRPGLAGLSENIEAVSIVGRFLEHSRVYYFGNGGQPDVWIGSADIMRRNLDRRIEVLCPVTDPGQVSYLRDVVLRPHFLDNQNAWVIKGDGSSEPVVQGESVPFSLQRSLMSAPAGKLLAVGP